ncbi:hypothetical protein P3L10_021547 [Capsicum annuum]
MEFNRGDHVGVASKEDGFLYKTLVKDDLSGPLEELVSPPELRPIPPEIRVDEFNLCDQVDAFDNDGWWVGMVTAKLEASMLCILKILGLNVFIKKKI